MSPDFISASIRTFSRPNLFASAETCTWMGAALVGMAADCVCWLPKIHLLAMLVGPLEWPQRFQSNVEFGRGWRIPRVGRWRKGRRGGLVHGRFQALGSRVQTDPHARPEPPQPPSLPPDSDCAGQKTYTRCIILLRQYLSLHAKLPQLSANRILSFREPLVVNSNTSRRLEQQLMAQYIK
jgi:hypothetical protein